VIEGGICRDDSGDLILFAGGDDFLELPDGKIGRNTVSFGKERDVDGLVGAILPNYLSKLD
jgi:hypothetical protein